MIEFGYYLWHMELRKIKGEPGDCIECGKSALDWALKEELHEVGALRYIEDQDAYEAMCRSCHAKRDKIGQSMTLEGRERMAASKRGKPRSAETRAKLSAALKGRPRDRAAVEKSAAARRGTKRDPTVAAQSWETRKAKYGPSGRRQKTND